MEQKILTSKEEETPSTFVEYLGASPQIKVLDFIIEGQDFDYSMTEVARGARVGWSSFSRVWDSLIEKEVVIQTRTIGNAKLFKINKANQIVKKIIQIDTDLTKISMDNLNT